MVHRCPRLDERRAYLVALGAMLLLSLAPLRAAAASPAQPALVEATAPSPAPIRLSQWHPIHESTPARGARGPGGPDLPASWIRPEESRWSWEVGVTGWLGDRIYDLSGPDTDHALLSGGSVRVGALYQTDPVEDTCTGSLSCIGPALGSAFRDMLVGNQYGIELRGQVWHTADATWMGVALDPQMLLVWGKPGDSPFERIRTLTLLGSILPEMGVLFEPDGDMAFQLRLVFPVSVLVTRNFGLEFRFAQAFVYPRERPNSFGFSFGLGVLFR